MRQGYYVGLLVGYKIPISAVRKLFGQTITIDDFKVRVLRLNRENRRGRDYDEDEDEEAFLKVLARKLKCRCHVFGDLMGGPANTRWVVFHPKMPRKVEGQSDYGSFTVEGYFNFRDIFNHEFDTQLKQIGFNLTQLGFNPGKPIIGPSWDIGMG